MKILFVASEALPFASTGGLADVAGSLPAAVKKAAGRSSDVRVVMPLYASVKEKYSSKLTNELVTSVALAWRRQYCGIYSLNKDGVIYYFIDNEYYFNRSALYGHFDDGERFAFFGKAVLELMSALDFYPDIMHANDWQSAPAVIYLKRKCAHLEQFSRIKVLFTIHNIAYQGKYDQSILGDVFELGEWDRDVVEYDGCINLLKGAIVCADMVSTVSRRYADEILTAYYAEGLDGILNAFSFKLTGVINGIDIKYYNPEKDKEIAANFSADDTSAKALDKKALCELCGFEYSDAPLIAMVSRLAAHKGFDLIERVIEEIICTTDINFCLLGTGEKELESFFASLAARYPQRFCVMLKYDKALSKQIYAGADMFLMPSKSEPCGLSQMIASRYATVPIVRETGGLYDSIKPYNKFTLEGNGFTFTNYNAHDMMNVIKEAAELYKDKEKWSALMHKAITTDFSWNASAEKYIEIYKSLING